IPKPLPITAPEKRSSGRSFNQCPNRYVKAPSGTDIIIAATNGLSKFTRRNAVHSGHWKCLLTRNAESATSQTGQRSVIVPEQSNVGVERREQGSEATLASVRFPTTC